MNKETKNSGSVKINPDVLEEARELCRDKGLVLQAYVTKAVFTENKKQKRDKSGYRRPK